MTAVSCIPNLSRRRWFITATLFIGAVSLYDAWLVVHFSEYITYMEQNPVGRWLLRVNAGDVGVLVRVKLAGTMLVLVALTLLEMKWQTASRPVTASLSAFQAGLLYYLTLY